MAETKILAPEAKIFTFANKKLEQTSNVNSCLVLSQGLGMASAVS